MASKARPRLIDRLTVLLERPADAPTFVLVSALVIVLGAVYCSGYEALSTGFDNWPGSLIWAAYALWPWFALFEAIKVVDARRGRRLPVSAIALSILAVGALSLAAERIDYASALHAAPPVALSLLRRLPGVAIVVALISLNRIMTPRALAGAATAASDFQDLLNVGDIRWIGAADNYLEVHYRERVAMVRMTMRDAETRLAHSGFIRIHRSAIVNRAHVADVVDGSRGPDVRLVDGTVLPTGKAFARNLRAFG